jgi:hypothetical protein
MTGKVSDMGPVNWLAVVLAANLAVGLGIVWHGPLFRTGRPLLGGQGAGPRSYAAVVIVMLIAAAMLGHSLARIGAETLHAEPWLYAMQSGNCLRYAGGVADPCAWRDARARSSD